jgi:hypothetical protein
MAIKITLEFNTMAEAAAFLSGNNGKLNDPLPPQMQPAPVMAAPAMQMPPAAPAMQMPPAAPAAPAGEQFTAQSIAPVMQQFVTAFKPAGLKAAFAKHNLPPQISQLDQNGLNVMGAYLKQCIAAGQLV